METHSDRIAQGGSLPYFLRDNKGIVDEILHSKTTEKWDWHSIINEMPNEDAEEEVYQYLKHLPTRERRALMKEHEDDFNSYLVKLIEESQDEDYPDFLQVNYSLYRHLEANGNTIPDDLKRYFHEGYKGGFYKRYNAALRQGKDISPELTEALDKLTKSGSLPTDMMLHRYVDAGYLEANFGITNGMSADEAIEIIAKRKGSILIDKAYTSTSAIIENNVMEYQGVKIKILAPKGTKAFISDNLDESEILLPRGQSFEVVDVSKYHNAQGKDSVELVLKLQKEPVSTQHSTQNIAERAAERHAKRTAADIERIQTAWNQSRSSNALIEHLQKFGDLEYHYGGKLDETSAYKHWERLTNEQRLNVLAKGRFTGMLSTEEHLDFCNLYLKSDKDGMTGMLQEVLDNVRDGHDMEDENHYVFHFKNGKKIFFSEDFDKPLSKRDLERLDWVSANSGLSNYRYWYVDERAKADMMQQMGFIEYRNGRIVASWNGKDYLGNIISHIEENRREYERLKADKNYTDIVFNSMNGGLKALHRGHIIHNNPNDELFFGKYSSTQLEMRCQDILFKNGFSCILEDETKLNPITKKQLSLLDTRTNGEHMDIKAITQNNHGTIKNAITSKKEQLRRFNEQNDESASSLILYFEDPTYFNEAKVRKNIGVG